MSRFPMGEGRTLTVALGCAMVVLAALATPTGRWASFPSAAGAGTNYVLKVDYVNPLAK